MKSVPEFLKMKSSDEKISMVTCYDYWSAKIISTTDMDTILVGDSVAMVMHGHDSTVNASMDMMSLHTSAVRRGAKNKFIISDMPFLSHRQGLKHTVHNAGELLRAGANAVKLEVFADDQPDIKHLVNSGVPVVAHIGLTPQSVNQMGGYKVQGREEEQKKQLLDLAKYCEASGAFMLVLECIPKDLATTITETLAIPTIGIGAGRETDGQVLVLHDLLGLNSDFSPRFVRQFSDGETWIKKAISDFNSSIKTVDFPNDKECFL